MMTVRSAAPNDAGYSHPRPPVLERLLAQASNARALLPLFLCAPAGDTQAAELPRTLDTEVDTLPPVASAWPDPLAWSSFWSRGFGELSLSPLVALLDEASAKRWAPPPSFLPRFWAAAECAAAREEAALSRIVQQPLSAGAALAGAAAELLHAAAAAGALPEQTLAVAVDTGGAPSVVGSQHDAATVACSTRFQDRVWRLLFQLLAHAAAGAAPAGALDSGDVSSSLGRRLLPACLAACTSLLLAGPNRSEMWDHAGARAAWRHLSSCACGPLAKLSHSAPEPERARSAADAALLAAAEAALLAANVERRRWASGEQHEHSAARARVTTTRRRCRGTAARSSPGGCGLTRRGASAAPSARVSSTSGWCPPPPSQRP